MNMRYVLANYDQNNRRAAMADLRDAGMSIVNLQRQKEQERLRHRWVVRTARQIIRERWRMKKGGRG